MSTSFKHKSKAELALWLRNRVSSGDLVLDIGCGDKWYRPALGNVHYITIDAWYKFQPSFVLDLEEEDIPVLENSVDTVLMLDFIEHLTKERGYEIIEQAKRVSRNQIIILTPLGWDENKKLLDQESSPYFQNTFNVHKSLWSAADLDRCGFKQVKTFTFFKKCYIGIWRR